jgi:hypothetical protein
MGAAGRGRGGGPEDGERPRDERVQVLASVAIHGGAEMVILSIQNVSVSGALLSAEEEDLEMLPIGRSVQVTVFDSTSRHLKVELEARVVRHEPGGVALSWGRNLRAASLLKLMERCRR